MTRDADMPTFSAREVRYLESLPAVERVSQGRIHYADEFKRHCLRCYEAGESPAQIFRRAGLDSSLVGYKRIERCFARWKRTASLHSSSDRLSVEDDDRFDVPADRRWAPPVALPSGIRRGGDGSPDGVAGMAARGRRDGDDVYGLIIVQQARRIDMLEHEVKQLQNELRQSAARHPGE